MIYNPSNWYWLRSNGDLFSSAACALIEDSDSDFLAWRNAGNCPTPWPRDHDGIETIAALDEVLAPYGLLSGLDLGVVKERALATMIAYADSITAGIMSRYPIAEVASWPVQESEARAIKSGTMTAPLLAGMAAAAGMSLSDFADSVLDKAGQFHAIVVAVQAIRDATETAIEAATSADEVASALDSAKALADTKAAEMGLA